MVGVKHDVEMKIGGGKKTKGEKRKQQSCLQRGKNFFDF